MRFPIALAAVIIFSFKAPGVAFSAPQISDLVGNWTGTSLCQVRPSACHDEDVVFRFSKPRGDKITMQADKLVEGKAVTMGVSEWTYERATGTLTWEMPRGTWKLVVDGDTINGTLIVPENVVFRKVHLKKSK